MKKLLTLTALAGLAFTPTVFAQAFNVTLDVQNSTSELVVSEISPITFPVINVNNSTPAGSLCYTSYSANDAYSRLCRGTSAETGERKSGTFRVAGNGHTQVSLAVSAPTVQNGLKFTPSFVGTYAYRAYAETSFLMPADNYTDFTVWGHLELVDPAEVSTEQTVMTFDITATYQ